MGFVAELKRRNVFRVGLAYAVSAWLVLQVADLVVEHIESPDWVMDVLFFLVLVGFLVAVVVAWAYEVTPEGIQRDRGAPGDGSATVQTARKLDMITLAAVGGLLALVAWNHWGAGETPRPPDEPLGVEQTATTPAQPGAALVKGVAVLPFESLSADPDDAYFAGGMHEDVLTQLAGIADLRVISRTSMALIAQRGLSVPELARQLGVSHVLEGSVRRDDDRVRVTVQLIDGADDTHVWADNYDRRLDDIFAIQTEIAMAIAAELEATLSPTEEARLSAIPTTSLEAYDLYLRAVEIERRADDVMHHARQAELLEQAVALDPDFLDALVNLADAYARQVFHRTGLDGPNRQRAEDLVERIEARWPASPEARLARANFSYAVERDFDRALAGYLGLEPESPNDPEMLMDIAASFKRLGRFEEGLEYLAKALLIDPELPQLYSERALQQAGAEHWNDVLPGLEAAALRFPGHPLIDSWIAHFGLMLHGDLAGYQERILDGQGLIIDMRYFAEGLGEQPVFRLAAEREGIEAVLEQLETLREPGDPWLDLLIDGQVAELLRIDGRPEASRARADRALRAVRGQVAATGRVPGNEDAERFAQLAYVACLAGNRDAADEYRALWNATTSSDSGFDTTDRILLVLAQAACGDPQGAWEALPDAQSPWLNFTDRSLVLDPLFQHYFGDLPGYRALVAGEVRVAGPWLE